MIKADLYGALSRGYCHPKNSHKVVDPNLIEAMADEILLLYCQNQGKLDIKDLSSLIRGEKKERIFGVDEDLTEGWNSAIEHICSIIEEKE